MPPTRARRRRPLYPALVAAVALGGAVLGCGLPDGDPRHQRDLLQQQPLDGGADAGGPQEPEFYGGAAPYEAFDGGTAP